MRTLRDLPIKHKVLAVVMLVTGFALLLSGAATIVADAILFRAGLQRDVQTLAHVVGDNATGALAFDSPGIANEILHSLRARRHIVSACIYRQDGARFATYFREASAGCRPPKAQEDVDFSAAGGLEASHPIVLENRRIGTMVMLYDLDGITERIRLNVFMVLGFLAASSLIALLVSSKLRDAIVDPITRLAQAATSVSRTGDY